MIGPRLRIATLQVETRTGLGKERVLMSVKMSEKQNRLVEQACTYLTRGEYPLSATSNEKRIIRRKAKKLCMEDGEIFYVQSNGIKVNCLHQTAAVTIDCWCNSGEVCFGSCRETKNHRSMSLSCNFWPFGNEEDTGQSH